MLNALTGNSKYNWQYKRTLYDHFLHITVKLLQSGGRRKIYIIMLRYCCIFKESVNALWEAERLKQGMQTHMLIGGNYYKYIKLNG